MRHTRMDFLAWLAMGAAVVVSAHGEWVLAVQCGFHPLVAAGLPLALDTYAIRALRAGREVFLPVLGMIATNAAAHLLGAKVLHPGWQLIVLVSAIAPLVLWRVHVLHAADTTTTNQPAAAPVAPVERSAVAPVPAAAPAEPQPVPAAPKVYPAPVLASVAGQEPELAPGVEPVRELAFLPLPARPIVTLAEPNECPQPVDEPTPGAAEQTADGADDLQDDPAEWDELAPAAAAEFANLLARGDVPSVRTLRAEYGIGQTRAQRVQAALRSLTAVDRVPA
ncbi:hypothetical protein AB0442_38175 [Kitasatospora sp. NPDC085895]|uniref:hypothetical protein n=1 Tax=Kitasatospora sp. NPDC085895 TaxID=3155057 RepID=UPI00344D8D3E